MLGSSSHDPAWKRLLVLHALNNLGATARQVATELAARGASGYRHDPSHCAVAHVLRPYAAPLLVHVDYECIDLADGSRVVACVTTPAPVVDFMTEFEEAIGYSELGASAHVRPRAPGSMRTRCSCRLWIPLPPQQTGQGLLLFS